MKLTSDWILTEISNGSPVGKSFKATVPGCIQKDYAIANNFGDWFFSDNVNKFDGLEDKYWKYSTIVPKTPDKNERLFFVAEGIDYSYDVLLNGNLLLSDTGMYSTVKVALENAKAGDALEVIVHPAPKHDLSDEPNDPNTKRFIMPRSEADRAVKPPMQYGWDCHPRLITQGIWGKAYFYYQPERYIEDVDITYKITGEILNGEAEVKIAISANTNCENLTYGLSLNGRTVCLSNTPEFNHKVKLWYPTGRGNQVIYECFVSSKIDDKTIIATKKVGFRKVRLIMNTGAWKIPEEYPKTRSPYPFQLEINMEKIFCKGSNWAAPEVFASDITPERVRELLTLAKDCNMNFMRMHGGSIINKDFFFDIADELGIMLWQEFNLACNTYDGDEYLKVLDKESKFVLKSLKHHPSIVLWCGGNELFNEWSGMTDQAEAFRILNKNTYEIDKSTPFIPTSPLSGITHGHYVFKKSFPGTPDVEVMERYNSAKSTAYVEFGMSSFSSKELLKTIIPEDELYNIAPTKSYIAHHSFRQFLIDSWGNVDTIDEYFGKQDFTDILKKAACYNPLP